MEWLIDDLIYSSVLKKSIIILYRFSFDDIQSNPKRDF